MTDREAPLEPHPPARYRMLPRRPNAADLQWAAWRAVEAGVRLAAFKSARAAFLAGWKPSADARAHLDDIDGDARITTDLHYDEAAIRRLSILASEVLHHSRTALDYCVYTVGWLDSGRPPSGTMFPLCTDDQRWKNERRTRLRGMSEQHRDWIHEVQPIAQTEWTRHLATLSNRDKHRTPVEVSPQFTFAFDLNELTADPHGEADFVGFPRTEAELDVILIRVMSDDDDVHLPASPTLTGIVHGTVAHLNRFMPLQNYEPIQIAIVDEAEAPPSS